MNYVIQGSVCCRDIGIAPRLYRWRCQYHGLHDGVADSKKNLDRHRINKTIDVLGRAWWCVVVRGRSCVVVRSRAWSCAVVRAWLVVRGRSVLPASRPALPWHERRNERTTSNNPLNPPGVGQIFFILLRWEYLWAHACQIWERSDGRFENFVFQIYK